jgi:hypothetical protein
MPNVVGYFYDELFWIVAVVQQAWANDLGALAFELIEMHKLSQLVVASGAVHRSNACAPAPSAACLYTPLKHVSFEISLEITEHSEIGARYSAVLHG